MTDAGSLKHPVILQAAVKTPDGAGGFTDDWQDLPARAEDMASIEALSASARLAQGRLRTEVTHRLTLRWRGDILPGMRAVAGSGTYAIVAALDRDGGRRWVEVLAYLEV